MNIHFKLASISAVIGVLALGGQAFAAQHEISKDEVEKYFLALQQEATEIVSTGDAQRLVLWTERNVAEGARFHMNASVFHKGARKVFTIATIDKDDIMQVRGLIGAGLGEALADYSLTIKVNQVTSHGPGAATVHAHFEDSGVVRPGAEGEKAAKATAKDGKISTMSFKRSIECQHILQRQGDRMVIGLTNCTGEVRL